MSNSRDPTRLRQGLNPLLTTSLGGFHNQLSTPLSAVSLASTHPYSAHTPASAIQPYNPQEWIGSPIAGPERTHQFPEPQGRFLRALSRRSQDSSSTCALQRKASRVSPLTSWPGNSVTAAAATSVQPSAWPAAREHVFRVRHGRQHVRGADTANQLSPAFARAALAGADLLSPASRLGRRARWQRRVEGPALRPPVAEPAQGA